MSRLMGVSLLGFCLAGVFMFAGRGDADENTISSSKNIRLETRKLLRAADASYRRGERHEALILLDSVLAIDPSNPDGYFLKGRISLLNGDSTAALETLNEASLKAPRSTRIKLLLARVHLKKGDYRVPLEMTESVLAIKPFDGEASFLRGWGLLLSGDTAKAVDILEKVLDKELGEAK